MCLSKEVNCSLKLDGNGSIVRIREYNMESDMNQVEELEQSCEIGNVDRSSETSLFTHILTGDPLCRVRNYTSHCMMVHAILYVHIRCSYIDVVCI